MSLEEYARILMYQDAESLQKAIDSKSDISVLRAIVARLNGSLDDLTMHKKL